MMVVVATGTVALGGCTDDSVSGPSVEPNVTDLVVVPDHVLVDPGDSVQFHAYGRTPDLDSVAVEVTWSTARGTITQSGLYVADVTTDNDQVTATLEGRKGLTKSAGVGKRFLVEVFLDPASVTLSSGDTQRFEAFGVRNSQDTVPVNADFSAQGGEIHTNGLYTAGDVAGTYQVVGTDQKSGLSGAAEVTIREGSTTTPGVVTTSLPGGQVGQTYRAMLEGIGGDGTYEWALLSGSLPAGLALSASGNISGTPTTAGTSEFTVQVTSAGQTASRTLSIVVEPSSGNGEGTSTTPNLKVAFIGDQGDGGDAVAVLELIRDEGADMVLHQGDFDYADDPDAWDTMISSVLGADFPYFASVGNHDDGVFYGGGGYQERLEERLGRVQGATCSGDLGVNSACEYEGLFFILSGVGTLGSGHESYLEQQLSADASTWQICSWHKNQTAMQVGGKGNEVGWLAYETCREHGAIIATGHEHSYSRTKTLVSTQNQTVDSGWPEPNILHVAPGATFVFVSGLGGKSVRDQERCLPTTYPYGCNGEWAKIYTSDQGAQPGALFIEFHVDGNPNLARGYFKNINGEVIDEFTVTAR